jgi:hypothetical protein
MGDVGFLSGHQRREAIGEGLRTLARHAGA